jgi:hypothetical protein
VNTIVIKLPPNEFLAGVYFAARDDEYIALVIVAVSTDTNHEPLPDILPPATNGLDDWRSKYCSGVELF